MSNKKNASPQGENKVFKLKKWVRKNPFLRFISSCPYRSPRWDKSVSGLIRRLGTDAKVLDLGSGVSRRAKYVINLDIEPIQNVDIVADGHDLPFKDGVFDAVILEAVIEHVKEPKLVISEAKRTIREGGYICVAVPFMQGYHASPTDYQRYTIWGLEALLNDFEKVESGSCVGPTSALHWIFREYIGILLSFGNIWLYKFISLIVGWITFPLVFLDYLLIHYKNSDNIASAVFFIGKRMNERDKNGA